MKFKPFRFALHSSVRYYPTIGGPDDGKFYRVVVAKRLEDGSRVYWLKGKADYVAEDALKEALCPYKPVCPACGSDEIIAVGTMEVNAYVEELAVFWGDNGEPQVDPQDGTPQESEFTPEFTCRGYDFDHDHFTCEACEAEFLEPKFEPTTEEEKERLKAAGADFCYCTKRKRK